MRVKVIDEYGEVSYVEVSEEESAVVEKPTEDVSVIDSLREKVSSISRDLKPRSRGMSDAERSRKYRMKDGGYRYRQAHALYMQNYRRKQKEGK